MMHSIIKKIFIAFFVLLSGTLMAQVTLQHTFVGDGYSYVSYDYSSMKKEGRTLKQEQELFMIGAVLNGKGIPTESCISSDRPDIIIPTEDKKAIGVEVVTYRATNNAENETALYKILVEYGKKVDTNDID